MSTPKMKNMALAAIVLCGIIAGTNGVLIKSMSSMSAGAIGFFRTFIPALFLFLLMLRSEKSVWRGNNRKMLVASSINAGRMYLYLIAFIYTSIGNAVVLFYTWPIFTAIIGMVYPKEKVSLKHMLLLLSAFVGLVVIYSEKSFSFEDRDFIGMVAAVGAALGYSITVIIFKSESDNYHRNELIFFQNLVGAFIFLPFFILDFPSIETSHLSIAVFYAFLVGIVIFSLFFYGLKILPATMASSLMYLEVVSAILIGVFFLGESMSIRMIVGGVMIIASSFSLTQMRQ